MTAPSDSDTLRSSIRGYAFVLTVVEVEDALFEYRAEIEGQALWVGKHSPIRSKGDALQLGLAAVEESIAALPEKRG